SGGAEVAVGSVGPKIRTYTQSVAIDLRIVDTRSLLVVRTISLTKQFTGYETGFGIFRFFGSDLFDINVGAKGQEPLQLGIRTALEEATLRLVSTVARVDPASCMARASWKPAPEQAAAPVVETRSAPTRPTGISAAFNGRDTVPGAATASAAQVPFEIGSADLSGSASALLDRIAAAAARGSVTVTIVARDTENLDPGARDALTDRRIAALVAALARRGVARKTVATLWRPDPRDPAIVPDSPGLQRIAALRIGR
ncbi:MAG: CsgG/HfaB family protein, partial [Sphingobium limneticum]